MTMYKEGNRPAAGTPNAKCYAFTFGVRLASGKVTPCTAQGQLAEFVFNDTVDAIENGFGVGLLSKTHSDGIGVPVLAGGAISAGGDVGVGMVSFVDNDGVTVSLPVAIAAADLADGDYIVGKATMGSSATEADTDVNAPSIALEFYDVPRAVQKGTAVISEVIEIPVDLASIAAAGDVATDWTPAYAGTIVNVAFLVTVPVTTGSKAADLNLEINATNLTGGVVALTSATATPVGKVIAGSAITGNNTFDANDTISVEAANVTAFTEGEGVLLITVQTAPAIP